MVGILGGIRVVELGEMVSAPHCTRMLAGLGAEVVKVEPPEGDRARRHGPFPDGAADPEGSGLFLNLNLGKRGVTLDLRSPAGRKDCLELLRRADVVVENLPVGFLRSVGLDYLAVRRVNPGLVMVSISPFGQSGPHAAWKGYDLNSAGFGGWCIGIGMPDREPLAIPASQAETMAGVSAAGAALAGLLHRERSGRGQSIDIAVSEVVACLFSGGYVAVYVYEGAPRPRHGFRSNVGRYPQTTIPCRDGHVVISAPQLQQWIRLVELMGKPAWSEQPRYRDRRAMQEQYPDEVDALLAVWFNQRTKEEAFQLGIQQHVPLGPVRRIDEVLQDRQLHHRQFFWTIHHPIAGEFQYPGAPFIMSKTPWAVTSPAPTLGGDNAEVFRRQPESAKTTTPAEDPQPSAVPAHRTGPLEGVRVLDFGTAVAGPMMGQFLADLGAQVIKVESRQKLDGLRVGRPVRGTNVIAGDEGHEPDLQPHFHALNRGKLSLTINLKDPRGLDLLLRLVRVSDVVIDNSSAGVMMRAALGYEQLEQVRPDIIQLSLSGAGQSGPLRDMVAYAAVMMAISGQSGMVGYPGERPLHTVSGDPVAASHGVVAILAALFHRRRTGEGQFIDHAGYAAAASMLGEPMLAYQMTKVPQGPTGNFHPTMAPHGIYPCRRDSEAERWIAIAVGDQEEWLGLAQVAAPATWAHDARFATPADRLRNRPALDEAIGAWTKGHDRDELVERLQQQGVAATPVWDIDELYFDEQTRQRDLFPDTEHPTAGIMPVPRLPWHFSAAEVAPKGHAPLLGQHTAFVCHEILGMSEEEISRLADVLV